MDLISVLSIICGISFILYGMHTMGGGLEKAAGGKFEKTLEKFTNSPIKGLLFGIIMTAAIQSSAATTVMTVGFVNSGIMTLYQATGVIMGANIGTTVTSWIFSLVGISSDNVVLQLLKPANFAPIFALLGVIFTTALKNPKKKNVGTIFLGFAILMHGMSMMTAAVAPLAEIPEFRNILVAMENPLFGVVTGALLTAIIHSSAASVGILQALSVTGAVTYGNAIPIILGQNIGTCATALISCIGATKNAKRTALIHLYFNLIGTILFLSGFYALNAVLKFDFVTQAMEPAHIAMIHSMFNVGSTVILFPFYKLLTKLAEISIRDSASEEELPVLDERLLGTPSVAVEQCRQSTIKMANLVQRTILGAIEQLNKYDPKEIAVLHENEDLIDKYEDILGTYLVKLSSHDLNFTDSNEISKILHTIGDLERIGDHADNILEVVEELHEKGLSFSSDAKSELDVLLAAIKEIVTTTVKCFVDSDVELASYVEPLEQVVDALRAEMKTRHIERLQEGNCTIELGFMFADMLSNCERVSDHCSNIAVCVIQMRDETFDTHDYLKNIKKEDSDSGFKEKYEAYLEKYKI